MDASHDHPIRGRFHTWFLTATEKFIDQLHGERKRRLFAGLPERVVELGPGMGANFPYYKEGTQLVAIEPNRRMHGALRERAQAEKLALELRGLRGEKLDLPNESVEAVVCTLVLCSVDDPRQVVGEALRVLRPGGRFIFIEHVAAPAKTWLRRFQAWVQPPWTYWFEGCRPTRETESVLQDAGFASVDVDRFRVPGPFIHCSPHIAGTAVK